MSGVDMALFANDACGQPIPWEHCCPWMYFDGKLLQSKLIRANREKTQLIDLCDGQVASSTTHTYTQKAAVRAAASLNTLQEFCLLLWVFDLSAPLHLHFVHFLSPLLTSGR